MKFSLSYSCPSSISSSSKASIFTLLVFLAQMHRGLSAFNTVSSIVNEDNSNLIETTAIAASSPFDMLEFNSRLKKTIFSSIPDQNKNSNDDYYSKNFKQIFIPLFEKVELIANLTGINKNVNNNEHNSIELYNGDKGSHLDYNQTDIEPKTTIVSKRKLANNKKRPNNLKVIDTEEDQLMSESYPRRRYRKRPPQYYGYHQKPRQLQRKVIYGKPQYRRIYLKPRIHPADSYYYKDGDSSGKQLSYDDEVYNHIADQKHVPHQYAIQIRWSKPSDNKNYRSKNDEKSGYRSYAHQEEEHWHNKNWIDIGNPPQLSKRDESTDSSNDYFVQDKRFNTLPVYARPMKTGATVQSIRNHFAVPSKSFPVNRRFVEWSNSPVNINSNRRGDYGTHNHNFNRPSPKPLHLPHYHF